MELGPQRGAEVLTAILDDVISAVIAELDRYGGDVIYFSGDAITGWIDGDDGSRATASALAMQATMARVGSVTTPGGHGDHPGDEGRDRGRTGPPLRRRAAARPAHRRPRRSPRRRPRRRGTPRAEGRSRPRSLGCRCAGRPRRAVRGTRRRGDRAALRCRATNDDRGGRGPRPKSRRRWPTSVVREWLLPAVYERIRTGRGEFLAELRAAYPVFLRFGGIDYDDDDEADVKLDAFVVRHRRSSTATAETSSS